MGPSWRQMAAVGIFAVALFGGMVACSTASVQESQKPAELKDGTVTVVTRNLSNGGTVTCVVSAYGGIDCDWPVKP